MYKNNREFIRPGSCRDRLEVGRLVRAERERQGLTRAQLCRLADCSLGYLASIEHGAGPKESPTVARIQAVLAALGDAPTTDSRAA